MFLFTDECSYHNLDQDEELRALPTVAKTIVGMPVILIVTLALTSYSLKCCQDKRLDLLKSFVITDIKLCFR